MQLGLILPHTGEGATPHHVKAFAQLAERCGFHGLWGVDHLVLPHHVKSLYPLGRQPSPVADGEVASLLRPNLELITTLTWVAAHTDRIALGSSVAVLPIRNPLTNARQLATLDWCSGGRLTYGVGIGWLEEEARALGLPWADRSRRAEEHISLLRAVWTAREQLVEFHGEFYDFDLIDADPRPMQPTIPILIGGHSDAALDRAARIGDGWIAAPMPPSALADRISDLRERAEGHDRGPTDLRIVGSMRAGGKLPALELLTAYADAGVDHLQVELGLPRGPAELEAVEQIATELLPHVA